jgi:CRISPR-associated protein Cmr1
MSKYETEITACVNALLAFGNVGSRSRNGFGSLGTEGVLNPISYPIDWAKSSPVEYPTLNSQSKLFVTKDRYAKWEDALSEIGIIYRTARQSLEARHTFKRRGFVSRPIEVKGEDIPPNIKRDKNPKQFILHVGKQKDKYFGQILSLPVLFYEKDGIAEYNKVINEMHGYFAAEMNEKKGAEITRLLGARS